MAPAGRVSFQLLRGAGGGAACVRDGARVGRPGGRCHTRGVRTIGLTGSIGSGKSTVAGMLAAHGATVIDYDALAREVVAPGTPGLHEVVAAFGADVLAADGSLDRRALASVVFADPDALARLDAIVHPRVFALAAQRQAQLVGRQAEAPTLVVHEVPLLVEARLVDEFDAVVVVTAPLDVTIERLRARGLREDEARARLAAQATDEERLAVADYVVHNDGTPDELAARVRALWDALTSASGG